MNVINYWLSTFFIGHLFGPFCAHFLAHRQPYFYPLASAEKGLFFLVLFLRIYYPAVAAKVRVNINRYICLIISKLIFIKVCLHSAYLQTIK